MIERKRNRTRSRAMKPGKYWCGCDRYFGSDVGKCPGCGAKAKGTDKKPAPIIDEFDLTAAFARSRAATEAAKGDAP